MAEELTDRQQRFCEEYLVDLNATRAAVRAGYSEQSAKEIGYENLTKPHIAAAIEAAMAERSERTKITADRVLREFARIAFADMRNFASWDSNGFILRDSRELSDDDAAVVAEFSQNSREDGNAFKFKLHDKKGALESLAKHLGLYSDGNNVQVNAQIVVTD